jgi:dTMP kinase
MSKLRVLAVEGIDGSGKTSLCQNLAQVLRRYEVDHLVMASLSFFEKSPDLGPRALSMYYGADFYSRWENFGQPAYETGRLVIADRYYYSALVRDVIRGNPEELVRAMYTGLPEPELVVYMQVSPEVAYERKLRLRQGPGKYESGADLYPHLDQRMAFTAFQAKCAYRYQEVLPADRTVTIDGMLSQEQARDLVLGRVLESLGLAGRTRESAS